MPINQYQLIQIQSEGDLSGLLIQADHKLAVFSGNIKTKVSPAAPILMQEDGVADESSLIEQMPPMQTLGKRFYFGPFPNRTITLIKLVTTQDATTITIRSTPVTLTSAGQTYTFRVESPTVLISDKPVLVAQVSTPLILISNITCVSCCGTFL